MTKVGNLLLTGVFVGGSWKNSQVLPSHCFLPLPGSHSPCSHLEGHLFYISQSSSSCHLNDCAFAIFHCCPVFTCFAFLSGLCKCNEHFLCPGRKAYGLKLISKYHPQSKSEQDSDACILSDSSLLPLTTAVSTQCGVTMKKETDFQKQHASFPEASDHGNYIF